jgi:hypothetical protein
MQSGRGSGHGCGRAATTATIAGRRTATSRRVKLRWRRLLRAGGEPFDATRTHLAHIPQCARVQSQRKARTRNTLGPRRGQQWSHPALIPIPRGEIRSTHSKQISVSSSHCIGPRLNARVHPPPLQRVDFKFLTISADGPALQHERGAFFWRFAKQVGARYISIMSRTLSTGAGLGRRPPAHPQRVRLGAALSADCRGV